MTYTISRNGEYLYVSRKPTEKERIRFISNGYNPPDLVREPKAVYQYIRGELPPNYPVPAIRYEVVYQLDDGDYWCGIYDVHREAIDADDCFTMLWNIRDNPRRPLFWSPVF